MKNPEPSEEIPDYEHSVACGPDTSGSLTEEEIDVQYGYMIRIVYDPQDGNRHRVVCEGLFWRRCKVLEDPDMLTFTRAKNHQKYLLQKARMEREGRRGVYRDALGRFR